MAKKKTKKFNRKNYQKKPIKKVAFDPYTYVYQFAGGNIKLGKDGTIVSWSTLKGDEPIYIPNLGYEVMGTCVNCEECKRHCYVNKSYNRFPQSSPFGHAKNTLGLLKCPQKVFADLDKGLTHNETSKRVKRKIRVVRINQSGEVQNLEQLISWSTLAVNHPNIKFYLYTKNFNIAEEFILNICNSVLPKNFHILYSIWNNNGVAEFERVKGVNNVHAFIYSNGQEGITTKNYCPAYDVKGKMNHKWNCINCKKCFSNSAVNKLIACHEH